MKLNRNFLVWSLGVASVTASASGVPVNVVEAEQGVYQPTLMLTAKLEAQEHANLTARVSGYLLEQYFPDGALVEEGDVLFQIDETPYKLALQSALANQQQAKAAMLQAKLNYDRTKELTVSGSATQANLDDAEALLSISEAALAMATSTVDKAQHDLWHTKIRAPYDGQLGKAVYSKGDMVSPSSGALIDIAQLHPLNASFSLGKEDFARFPIDQHGEVVATLDSNAQVGKINFVDNKFNYSTGTLMASATFENQERILRPNQIIKVRLTHQQEQRGFWIPQTALIQDLMMQFIYVVNDEGVAQRREVEVLARENGLIFLASGLSEGEQVITDGLIRVRPDASVSIVQ